jgi:excisionase family DNA binding protein
MSAGASHRVASTGATDAPVRPVLAAIPPRSLTRADLMTAADVAELVRVPVSTVREWGRNGTLPRVKLGRHVRFVRAQVEAAILASRDARL